MQNSIEDANSNCINCVSLQKQLQQALIELKTAETFISLLREDINHNSSEAPVDLQHFNTLGVNCDCEEGNCDQNSEKWSSVVSKSSKKKVRCDPVTVNQQQKLVTTNRFLPLATLAYSQEGR
jgi:hypothetical protein